MSSRSNGFEKRSKYNAVYTYLESEHSDLDGQGSKTADKWAKVALKATFICSEAVLRAGDLKITL